MSSTSAFPSDGFTQAFDNATWVALQKYISSAQHLPTSPTPSVEAILTKLEKAATAASSGPVTDAQSAANAVFNYGSTMVQTLKAIPQVLASGTGAKEAIGQLLGALASGTDAMTTPMSKADSGVGTFVNTTTGASDDLKSYASTMLTSVTNSNDSVSSHSTSLKTLLNATPLDPAAISAAIDAMKSAIGQMTGQSFVGLGFDAEAGISSGSTAKSQLSIGTNASQTLKAAIKALEAKVAQTPEDQLSSLPELSQTVLKGQEKAWAAVTDHAHSFMMNFNVTAG